MLLITSWSAGAARRIKKKEIKERKLNFEEKNNLCYPTGRNGFPQINSAHSVYLFGQLADVYFIYTYSVYSNKQILIYARKNVLYI